MSIENKLVETRFAVQIDTTRGMITIECEEGSKSVGYHYKPIEKLDPYYHGPVSEDDEPHIIESLRRSWIDPTSENIERIAKAAALVRQLANQKPG